MLNPEEYAFLIILKAVGRELSNTEMDDLYQTRLTGATHKKLTGDQLVSSVKKGSTYWLTLTDAGRKTLAEPLTVDHGQTRKGRSPAERTLWGALVAQQQSGTRSAPPTEDLPDRIRGAYRKLTGERGEWVGLASLRSTLADVPRAEVDQALIALMDDPDVRLEPESHRRRIEPADREAAVLVGGEPRHKLAIGLR
ncbi:hypothetical protein [Actinoplanes sp. NPDC049265]|uniref:hypothetical protein n=1 Tax=Actinoplanes sp. NPDC049265 TaxID=3363902 RepID=UPI0037105E78